MCASKFKCSPISPFPKLSCTLTKIYECNYNYAYHISTSTLPILQYIYLGHIRHSFQLTAL